MNEIYHYGMPHRSGRYPYGSGERPYQDRKVARKEARKKKNIEAGKERLTNRISRANALADVDRLSKKIGWENTVKAGNANKKAKEIKNVSKEIMESETRTESLGRYTRNVRLGTVSLTSASAISLAAVGSAYILSSGMSAGVLAIPFAGAGAIAKVGYEYYKKTFY